MLIISYMGTCEIVLRLTDTVMIVRLCQTINCIHDHTYLYIVHTLVNVIVMDHPHTHIHISAHEQRSPCDTKARTDNAGGRLLRLEDA